MSNVCLHSFLAVVWCSVVKCMPAPFCGCGVVLSCQMYACTDLWLWCDARSSNVCLHRFVAVVWCLVFKCMPAQVCGCGVVLDCQMYACTGLGLWCGARLSNLGRTGLWLRCVAWLSNVCLFRFVAGVVLSRQNYKCIGWHRSIA